MREPNFSESQLQQAVNAAYIRLIFEQSGEWVFANVPSLFDEFGLGWDTAFYFPWYRHLPNPNHEGCNFFIQYKLSGELKSAGAKEWEFWKAEYFRFKIPHYTKNASGNFFDDYHQWDRLRELATQGYPTFYATNSTLSKNELYSSSSAGTLLNTIPLLDVRSVATIHKHVTFTSSSKYFLLHSEKETSQKIIFSTALERMKGTKASSVQDSVEKLRRVFNEVGRNDEQWANDLTRISKILDSQLPPAAKTWTTYFMLCSFARKHIGAEMLWLPSND